MSLREFVKTYILQLAEATAYDRYAKANGPIPQIERSVIDKLKELATEGNNFIHFSNLNKLGIYPGSTEQTGPWGLYFYELTPTTVSLIEENKIPYAGERTYIHVFTSQNNPKILDLQAYPQENLKSDFYKLLGLVEKDKISSPEEIKRFKRRSIHVLRHSGSPGSTLWNLTRMISDENLDVSKKEITGARAKVWRSVFSRLGYDGAIDRGGGIIHPDEKSQGVFFSSQFVQPIVTFDNPLAKQLELATKYKSGQKPLTPQAIKNYEKNKNVTLWLATREKQTPIKGEYTMDDVYNGTPEVRVAAIKKLDLNVDTLHSIYENDDYYLVRRAVVEKLPAEELSPYVDSYSETVREIVASRIPVDELYKFKNDYDSDVLHHVVKRTEDEELLVDIAENTDVNVFIRLLALEKIKSLNVIAAFYQDHEPDIRNYVAMKIPLTKLYEEEIEALLNDSSFVVKKEMKARLRSQGYNPFQLETLPQ